jgi:hypothetical protein
MKFTQVLLATSIVAISGAVHLSSNSESHDGFDDFTDVVEGTAKANGKGFEDLGNEIGKSAKKTGKKIKNWLKFAESQGPTKTEEAIINAAEAPGEGLKDAGKEIEGDLKDADKAIKGGARNARIRRMKRLHELSQTETESEKLKKDDLDKLSGLVKILPVKNPIKKPDTTEPKEPAEPVYKILPIEAA